MGSNSMVVPDTWDSFWSDDHYDAPASSYMQYYDCCWLLNEEFYMICLALTGMTMNVVMSKTVAIGRIATTATIVDGVDVSSDDYSRSWQRCTVCNGIMSASRVAAAEQHCDVQPIRTLKVYS